MSRIVRFSMVTAAALGLAGVAAFAQPANPQPQPEPQARQWRMARPQAMFAGLNLTADQREQLRKLREDNRVPMRDHRLKLQDARRALRLELFADAPDQGKVADLQNQVVQLVQQVEARELELQEQMAAILTPEQRQLARERRAMREWRQPRQNRRPPGGGF